MDDFHNHVKLVLDFSNLFTIYVFISVSNETIWNCRHYYKNIVALYNMMLQFYWIILEPEFAATKYCLKSIKDIHFCIDLLMTNDFRPSIRTHSTTEPIAVRFFTYTTRSLLKLSNYEGMISSPFPFHIAMRVKTNIFVSMSMRAGNSVRKFAKANL